jgi:ribosomal protein S20
MRRNHQASEWAVLGLLGLFWAASLAMADTTSSGSSQGTKTTKDPVAAAFALPHGVTLDAKQQRAYKKLKSQYESPLRNAISQIQSNDKNESAQGLKQNREVRAKIKTGIKDILAMSSGQPRQNAPAVSPAAYQRPAGGSAGAGGSCPCGR